MQCLVSNDDLKSFEIGHTLSKPFSLRHSAPLFQYHLTLISLPLPSCLPQLTLQLGSRHRIPVFSDQLRAQAAPPRAGEAGREGSGIFHSLWGLKGLEGSHSRS